MAGVFLTKQKISIIFFIEASLIFTIASVLDSYWLRVDGSDSTVPAKSHSGLWQECVHKEDTPLSDNRYICSFIFADDGKLNTIRGCILISCLIEIIAMGLVFVKKYQRICGVILLQAVIFKVIAMSVFTEGYNSSDDSSTGPTFGRSFYFGWIAAVVAAIGSVICFFEESEDYVQW